jgi:hypothetical protein
MAKIEDKTAFVSEADTVRREVLLNKKRLHFLSEPFRRVFNASLEDYLDGKTLPGLIIGFEITKFEAFLGVEDSVSMADMIKEKYGQEGVSIIRKLIGMEPV